MGVRISWRWSRIKPGVARPTFYHLRTQRRNPLDDKVLRIGPFQARW